MTPALLDKIDGYRVHFVHFDTMYVGGIPRPSVRMVAADIVHPATVLDDAAIFAGDGRSRLAKNANMRQTERRFQFPIPRRST